MEVGDLLTIDTDHAEWGRVCGEATVCSLGEGDEILVTVESIKANIIIPYVDIQTVNGVAIQW